MLDIALFQGCISKLKSPCSVSRRNQNLLSSGLSPIENSLSVFDATIPPFLCGQSGWSSASTIIRLSSRTRGSINSLPSYHQAATIPSIAIPPSLSKPGLPAGFHGNPLTSTRGLSLVDHKTISCFPAGLPSSSSSMTSHHHQSQVK